MRYRPRSYQEQALGRVLNQHALGLLLDPGLGKTSIILEGFMRLRMLGQARRLLVVAPKNVCEIGWPAELTKWGWERDLRMVFVNGPRKAEILAREADVYLINPAGLPWLVGDAREPGPWRSWAHKPDMLAVDESTDFRHPTADRFRALRRILGKFDRRYIMTGTPAPRCLSDLWGQMFLLDQGATLGRTLGEFRERYMVPVQNGRYFSWVMRRGAEQDIYAAIAPLVMRLDARDVLDLPELATLQIPVHLPPAARVIYDAMKRDMVTELREGVQLAAMGAGAATIKCLQIANGSVYHETEEPFGPTRRRVETVHDAKAAALESLLAELGGKPALVVYRFRHDLDAIRRRLGRNTPAIVSGMPQAESNRLVTEWNRGLLPVLCIPPMRGLNLQDGGSVMVWYGLTYDLEMYDQTVARLHRQGQTRRTVVYQLLAENTVDQTVGRILERKARTQRDLLDALRVDLGIATDSAPEPL